MAAMTQKELIEEVQARLGDPASLAISPTVIARLATRAYDRVARLTHALRSEVEIELYTEADVYFMGADSADAVKNHRVISATFVYKDGDTKKMEAVPASDAVKVGPTSARSNVSFYSHFSILPGDALGSSSPQWPLKFKIWPYPNLDNVTVDTSDTSAMTKSGAKIRLTVSTDAPVVSPTGGGNITPHWLSEAVLLETVANAALLPQSQIKDQATIHRQLADRAIREARQYSNSSFSKSTPVPTGY